MLQVPALAGTCARAKSGARQRSRSSSPPAGWMRCWSGGAADSAGEGWGLCAAHLAAQPCGLALTSAADKEHGSAGWQDGRQQALRSAAPYPGLGGVRAPGRSTGSPGCRQTGGGKLTKKLPPPSPKSRGKASGEGSHAGRERCPAGQLKLAGLEAAAATRLPALLLPPCPAASSAGPCPAWVTKDTQHPPASEGRHSPIRMHPPLWVQPRHAWMFMPWQADSQEDFDMNLERHQHQALRCVTKHPQGTQPSGAGLERKSQSQA